MLANKIVGDVVWNLIDGLPKGSMLWNRLAMEKLYEAIGVKVKLLNLEGELLVKIRRVQRMCDPALKSNDVNGFIYLTQEEQESIRDVVKWLVFNVE